MPCRRTSWLASPASPRDGKRKAAAISRFRISLRLMTLPVQDGVHPSNVVQKFARGDWKPTTRKVKGAPHVLSSPHSARIWTPSLQVKNMPDKRLFESRPFD